MTAKRCGLCSDTGGLWEACVYDTSGGSMAYFCTEHRLRIERRGEVFDGDVCVICAEHHPNPGRACGFEIYNTGPRRVIYHICDPCRRGLIFEPVTPGVVEV